jgi:signal transduction histidine kinase
VKTAFLRFPRASAFRPYLAAVSLVAAATAIGWVARATLQPANISTIFLLGVLLVAFQWGGRPAYFAAALSAVAFDFCFVPPYFGFALTDLPYAVTTAGFLSVAFTTSTLSSRARDLARAQEARARAEARAQTKDEILNQIAHELRSPLNAVLNWAELLGQASPGDPSTARAVAGVERSARLLCRLADDLVTTSRINSGKLLVEREPTVLAPVVALAADAMRGQAVDSGLTLNVLVATDDEVLADRNRVEQIVGNLLSNAIRFTPRGGSLAVSLERRDAFVVLTVRDSGIGIRREFLPKVFEQFSQAERSHGRQGLGLGLAIVHHLVAAHGGRIDVDSAGEGQGTTVTVSFPRLSGR